MKLNIGRYLSSCERRTTLVLDLNSFLLDILSDMNFPKRHVKLHYWLINFKHIIILLSTYYLLKLFRLLIFKKKILSI